VLDDSLTVLLIASMHEAPETAKLFEKSHREMNADAFWSRMEPPLLEAASPEKSLAAKTFVQACEKLVCECLPTMAIAAPEDATA